MNEYELKMDYKNLSQKELIGLLERAEDLLKKKDNEVDRLKTFFLANISHEIRTLMNAIVGFSDLLKDFDLSIEDRIYFADNINDNSLKLLRIIDDIIQTAKIESQDLSLNKKDCDVHLILEELLDFYTKNKGNIGKEDLEIDLKKGKKSPLLLHTDPVKLKQALSNLIDNALKFTEFGYVEFGYQIPDNKNILFFVKDTGIGIPNDKYNVIFEKFHQVETIYNKKYNGLGVGLTISNDFVHQLGGVMGLRSELGRGSEFYFTLPNTNFLVKPKKIKRAVKRRLIPTTG
jgi:signal transduction histidine kinase